MKDFEFYETPQAFTHYLFETLMITGRMFEPCVGSGAIVRAAQAPRTAYEGQREWVTNDLDPRWPADYRFDAAGRNNRHWEQDILSPVHWTVSNPPFTPAIEIIENAIGLSQVGVAMHLRASIHEVLKTGIRRTWMAKHTPTGILWLPRFAYQRSKKTGEWSTDSVCACWVIWYRDRTVPQFIKYAPEWVLTALDKETPEYRKRMDAIMADRNSAA